MEDERYGGRRGRRGIDLPLDLVNAGEMYRFGRSNGIYHEPDEKYKKSRRRGRRGREEIPSSSDASDYDRHGEGESPPEPAPAELPLRSNGGLRSKYEGDEGYHVPHQQPPLYIPPEYLLSGFKSPALGSSLATAKKLFQSDQLHTETAESNSTLSTLPSGARTNKGVPCAPVILPVFPSSTPHPGIGLRREDEISGFNLQKECGVSDRCSWKCVSVALILLSLALISILIYFAAVMGSCSRYPGTGCIVVEDAKVLARGEKQPQLDPTSIAPIGDDLDAVSPTSVIPDVTSRSLEGLSPVELSWGLVASVRVSGLGFFTLELSVVESGAVSLNVSVPWGSNWAILARKAGLPSFTAYDIWRVVRNGALEPSRRVPRHSATPNFLVTEWLDPGRWFIRFFNDDLVDRPLTLSASVDKEGSRCEGECSGNGQCVLGSCVCFSPFSGPDCSTNVCPVLCSSHGRYGGGRCHCDVGWKGAECDVPAADCETPCGPNGECVGGLCLCHEGFIGTSCESKDCPDPSCSSHGQCIDGFCRCDVGWTGPSCKFGEKVLSTCVPDCSGRGEFEGETGVCVCAKPFTGPNCLEVVCAEECGPNGFCNGEGRCECYEGWGGSGCEAKTCHPRCLEHGECKNGSCLCTVGWNGKHCSLPGCLDGCSEHGNCVSDGGNYRCQCEGGWAGVSCSVRLETNCSDDVDNDEDGMADCSDSECCDTPHCRDHLMCMAANDPVEVLLRKQPPSVTASFFQRVKFLIEENSVQSYAQKDEYSESQFWNSFEPRFDILVNGGSSVTLQFQRNPFRPFTRTVYVPWNEIVVLDPPIMMKVVGRESGVEIPVPVHPCPQHDTTLKPIVVSSWFPSMVGGIPSGRHIFAETQMVQESIGIPGTDVHLVYESSGAAGYLSTIWVGLIGSVVPPSLSLLHLKIIVEGELYEKTFEAGPNITHTFGWRKRNVYQQKVYGLASAKVSVGYVYLGCSAPVWVSRRVDIKGFDVDIADVGGWNVDVHHHYNFHEGILQKGDGAEVHLRDRPRRVGQVMGRSGVQRPLLCDPCEPFLLAPVALATGPDGSLYVGDFNLVRRITPDKRIFTVVQLSATKVSHEYYMEISPADGHLYISDPEKYQIIRVSSLEEIEDPRLNFVPVVGSGRKCLPGDIESCGDGREARLARLHHPKGISFSSSGNIYFADGPTLRLVDMTGKIWTLVGGTKRGKTRTADLETCRVQHDLATNVQLHWPTNVGVDLADQSVYFLDEGTLLVYKGGEVRRAVGCEGNLPPSLDLALSPRGVLLLLTEDSNVWEVADGLRTRLTTNIRNSTGGNVGAGQGTALALGPDGTIYVADEAKLQILSLTHDLPAPNQNGDYEVPFLPTNQIFIFNRYGQHTATKDSRSGRILYSFLYTKNTSYGKLSKIWDAAENKILFLRDYSSVVSTIENSQGKKVTVKMNHLGRLVHFEEREGSEVKIDYSEDGLLLGRTEGTGDSVVYVYDSLGRVKRNLNSVGEVLTLSAHLQGQELLITADEGSNRRRRFAVSRSDHSDSVRAVSLNEDGPSEKVLLFSASRLNATMRMRTSGGAELTFASSPHGSHRILSVPDEGIFHSEEWKTTTLSEGSFGREMTSNSSTLLSINFDPFRLRDVVVDGRRDFLFSIQYDEAGRRVGVSPKEPLAPLNLTYDRFNRVESVRWGLDRGFVASYARAGFATQVLSLGGKDKMGIDYNEPGDPIKMTSPAGRSFNFLYDQHGGLRGIETPGGGKHMWSWQPSVGFKKFIYTPPGSEETSFVKYEDGRGMKKAVLLAGDAGRIVYSYDRLSRPESVYFSEGKIVYKYKPRARIEILSEGKFEATTHIWRNPLGRLTQEKIDFGAKSGLAAGKFVYELDSYFRTSSIKGRVGGVVLPDFPIKYGSNGQRSLLGSFRVEEGRERVVSDGVGRFINRKDPFGFLSSTALVIQGAEVFRLHFSYFPTGKLSSVRLASKTASYTEPSFPAYTNYTYDEDGRLTGVEGGEPWKFDYDGNSNLVGLTYRGNSIPLTIDDGDRLVRFGDGGYRYDPAGRLIENAREEFFTWNSFGQLKRAFKKGRFDVEYFYDSAGRLSGRKDSQGNVTQFFYGDPAFPLSPTVAYSPRENRLSHFVYDADQRLIYFQVNRNQKYYVGCDGMGSPLFLFNQYGEVVRGVARSPFGHVVYDSNPHFFLPIDFAGGIIDKATSLVHMRGGRVYDPLIGQFLSPDWEGILHAFHLPHSAHLYRLPFNDPVNLQRNTPETSVGEWATEVGFDLDRLMPHLPPTRPAPLVLGLERRILESGEGLEVMGTICPSLLTRSEVVKLVGRISSLPPPLGHGIVLRRSGEGKAVVSCPFCISNRIQRDVFTTILNGSEFLAFVSRGPVDVFHFAKKELWKASDDLVELKRLGGAANVSVHERAAEGQMDLKMAVNGATVFIKYGVGAGKEEARLVHHGKTTAVKRAWTWAKQRLHVFDFSDTEREEVLALGHASSHHPEFTHDPEEFPFFADDPAAVRLLRKKPHRGPN